MRILLSIHHPISIQGGAPGVTRELAHAYRRLGHHVDILSYENMPAWAQGKRAQVLFPWFIAGYVRRCGARYDVLDLSSGDGWLIRRQWLGMAILVTRSHGLEHVDDRQLRESARAGDIRLSWKYPIYHGGWRLHEVTRSFRKADLSLFLNQADRDYAVQCMGVDQARTELVPNGLPDNFLNLPLSSLESGGPIRVVMLGSYLQRKGFDYALPALERLLDRYQKLEVKFVGVGQHQALEERVASWNKTRYQIINQYRHAELPSLLMDSHIILFPSLAEGFGMAALEGMACGLALVATTVVGLSERLNHGHDALLIPTRNVDAIDHAIESLIEDAALLERLRTAGHAKAQEFSWQRIAELVISIYQKKRSFAI